MFIFLFFLNSFYEDTPIEIINIPKEFIPGKHHTLILKITNTEIYDTHPELNIKLPKGWSVITKTKVKTLSKGETARVIVTVYLPIQAKYGSQEIIVELKTVEGKIKQKTIIALVKKTHNIELKALSQPSFLGDDKNFSCSYVVTNKGNMNERVHLSSRKGTLKNEKNITIPSGSSVIVTVEQNIPKTYHNKRIIINDLSVIPESHDTIYSKNVPITVYPNVVKRDDIYYRYPIKGSLFYNFFDNNSQKVNVFQYDIEGKGFVDRSKKHFIEFIARGTDHSNLIRFENYSRYYVGYKHNDNTLLLGDFSFSLSRLLEHIRLGSGVSYTKKTQKFEFNAFYNKLKYYPDIKDQIGGYALYRPTKLISLKLNTIYRNYIHSKENTFSNSIEGVYNKNNLSVKSELAVSYRNDTPGFGAFATGFYKNKKYRVNGEIMFTGADFEGYYNDSFFISGTVNYSLNKHYTFSTGANYNFINPKTDTIFEQTSPFYQNYSVGLRYAKSKKHWHRINYVYRSNNDRSDLKKFNYDEHAIRFTNQFKIPKFNFRLSNLIANTQNHLSTFSKQFDFTFESKLWANYSFSKFFKFGVNAEYSEHNRYSEQRMNYLYYGGNISYYLHDKFNLNASFRNNYPLEEFYKTNSFFDLTFKYMLKKKHSFGIIGSYSNASGTIDTKDFYVSCRYNFKLNVPVSKNRELGHLHGKITTSEGQKLEGIVVNLNGMSAITNEEGVFEFNDVLPGEKYVTIENSSIQGSYISERPMPIETTIISQEIDYIEIKLLKPINISGKVLFKETVQIQSKEFKKEIPNLIIKLHNDQGIKYTTVNRKGGFRFSEIRPGKCEISIVTKGLGENFSFPNKVKQLYLENGNDVVVEFLMSTKSRKINISKNKFQLKIKH